MDVDAVFGDSTSPTNNNNNNNDVTNVEDILGSTIFDDLLESVTTKDIELKKEMEGQIIQLQKQGYLDVYKLKVIKKNFDLKLKEANTTPESCPFVISVIGETHVGKSSLIPVLLGEGVVYRTLVEKATKERKAPRREKDQGTTANVRLHSKQDEQGKTVYVLDMEGTGAKDIPYYLEQILKLLSEGNYTATVAKTLNWMRSNPQARRDAVESLLMTFAALISDVVVYIDIHPFSNASYFDRMSKLIKSIGQIDNLPPDLVLISNKCKMADIIWDDQEQTMRFLKETGRAEIDMNCPMGFSSVTCINLPDWTEMGEVSWDEARGDFLSTPLGAQKYVEKTKDLQKTLSSLKAKRLEDKLKLKLVVSEKIWLILLQKTILDFPNAKEIKDSKKIPSIWERYISVVSDVDNRANKIQILIYILLNNINKPSYSLEEISARYKDWRLFSIQLLAGIIVCGIKGKLNDVNSSLEIPEAALEKHLTEFDKLRDDMEGLKICSATHTRINEQDKQVLARCTRQKTYHQKNHHNPLPFFYATTDEELVIRFFKWLAAYVGIGFASNWNGSFVEGPLLETSLEDEKKKFLEYRDYFLKMEMQDPIIRCLASSLKKMLQDNDILIPRPYETVASPNPSEEEVLDLCAVCLVHSGRNCTITKGLCQRCEKVWNSI